MTTNSGNHYKSIEYKDKKVLTYREIPYDVKMLFVENHVATASLMKYTKDRVPFLVYPGPTGSESAGGFDEKILDANKIHFQSGPQLIAAFLKDQL